MSELLDISPAEGGAIVAFHPCRPWALFRQFRAQFPKAKPVANWRWFVPGRTAAARVAKWQAEQQDRELVAARRERAARADREWDAAAPEARP